MKTPTAKLASAAAYRAANRVEINLKQRARRGSTGTKRPNGQGLSRSAMHRIHRYGLTPEQVLQLIASQNGKCPPCGKPITPETAHIDHDHETGKVRGALCQGCNRGIGLLGDDPIVCEAAASYLRR